ncbi:MAG: helix-turn-helix domain-containing protein [Oscillospiraceae bacterium]
MLKVLIADKEQKARDYILNLTNWDKLDAQVVGTCSNGVEALEAILRLQPDVVMTEVCMDGTDGLDLIRHAKEHGLACEFVIVSRFRRFEYAQCAMRMGVEEYLTKPVEVGELTRVLEKMRRRKQARKSQDVDEQFFRTRQLLRNSFMETFTGLVPPKGFSLDSLNEKYHFRFREGIFQSAILMVDGLPPEEESFLPGLAEVLRARFEPVCYEIIPFVQANQRLTLTLNYAPGSEAEGRLPEMLDILRQYLNKRGYPDLSFCIGVGVPERDVSLLRHTLDTAERAVRCGILRGRSQMYWYDKLKFDAIKSDDILTPTLVGEMRSSAAILDHETFSYAVHSAFAPVSSYSDPAVVIDICHAAIDAVMDACVQAGYGAVTEEEHLSIIHRLGDATSLAATMAELLEWTGQQFDRCIQERRSSRPVRAAKEYIAKHYMKTLTLEEISKHVHLNASYLSIVFKKETGQNFSDYLTSYRIEVAKSMLRQGDMSIAAISEAVGYADSKYFSRIFTRLVGIKPSAYRTLHG